MRVVPITLDVKKVRQAAVVPAFRVKVPIVWSSKNETVVMPALARPANDNVLNVFAPETECEVTEVLVNRTMLYVNPAPAKFTLLELLVKVDVPALNVRPALFDMTMMPPLTPTP